MGMENRAAHGQGWAPAAGRNPAVSSSRLCPAPGPHGSRSRPPLLTQHPGDPRAEHPPGAVPAPWGRAAPTHAVTLSGSCGRLRGQNQNKSWDSWMGTQPWSSTSPQSSSARDSHLLQHSDGAWTPHPSRHAPSTPAALGSPFPSWNCLPASSKPQAGAQTAAGPFPTATPPPPPPKHRRCCRSLRPAPHPNTFPAIGSWAAHPESRLRSWTVMENRLLPLPSSPQNDIRRYRLPRPRCRTAGKHPLSPASPVCAINRMDAGMDATGISAGWRAEDRKSVV